MEFNVERFSMVSPRKDDWCNVRNGLMKPNDLVPLQFVLVCLSHRLAGIEVHVTAFQGKHVSDPPVGHGMNQ